MANEYYGKQILGELSDDQKLPNAGTVDSTNMVNIAGQTNGKLWIDVYAGTDISIAANQSFSIDSNFLLLLFQHCFKRRCHAQPPDT